MYCRKSTDSEDRQIQSIEDQEKELAKVVKRLDLNIIKKFCESKTAKQPGRPMFNEMLKMLENDEADGILCWKINRLARNPRDGGDIQWFLQQDIIKSIITPTKEYLPSDNVIMMSVELGMANQFILDLKKDVIRGMDAKVEKGWRPGKAPLGYKNDKYGDKGNKQIFIDEENFSIVRKMWDLLLTEDYTIHRIVEIVHKKLALRVEKGGKLALSTAYKIFTNPFYYGEYYWKGELKQGKHQPMITSKEFDRAQKILGKRGKPRPKYKRLPFNGVIRCGECGGMITAEEKTKKLASGKTKHYLYHHCSKRKKNIKCHQKSILSEKLIEKIEDWLDEITIREDWLPLALEVLRKDNKLEENDRNKVLNRHQNNYNNCLKSIDNLINLYISPQNANKEFLSEGEYKEQKNLLVKEKDDIEQEIRNIEERVGEWLELAENTFDFATYSKARFEKGNYEERTNILRGLGSNFYLKDGELTIEWHKSLDKLRKGLQKEPLQKARFEPLVLGLDKRKNSRLATVLSQWSG